MTLASCQHAGTGFNPPPRRSPPQILEQKKTASQLEFRNPIYLFVRTIEKKISVNKASDDVS